MSETRHSLNPEPRNVLVRVKSKQTVYRDGQPYVYGEHIKVTEWVATRLVKSGLVERI